MTNIDVHFSSKTNEWATPMLIEMTLLKANDLKYTDIDKYADNYDEVSDSINRKMSDKNSEGSE